MNNLFTDNTQFVFVLYILINEKKKKKKNCNMRNFWRTGPDSQTIRPTIEQNVESRVGIYHEQFQHDQIQNGRPADFRSPNFLVYTIHSAFLNVSLQNLCHISILLISRMSSNWA